MRRRKADLAIIATCVGVALFFALRKEPASKPASDKTDSGQSIGGPSKSPGPGSQDFSGNLASTAFVNAPTTALSKNRLHEDRLPTTLEDLRALAVQSKSEAELCSRHRYEPIGKQFRRLLNSDIPKAYRAEARKWGAAFEDIPYGTRSAAKALLALASESGRKLSERDYSEIAYKLKYCDAIGAFNVAQAMFALLERHPDDHELAKDLWEPLLRYLAGGADGPTPLLHQFIRIEILRGAARAGLIDPTRAALIDALVAERDRIKEEIHKDIDAYSAGGEGAKSFRAELEKTTFLQDKIDEALQKL